MSAAPSVTALSKLDEAVALVLAAQNLNAQMQRVHAPGTTLWHQHETIDDKLHDALAALGE